MAPSGQAAVVQCSTTLRRRALQRPYCWVVQQLPVLLDASRGTAYGERWSISLTLHLTRGSSTVDLAPPGWLCMLTTRHCMTPLNTWRLIVEPHSMQHSRHLWSAVLMQCCAHCWGSTVTTILQPVCSAGPVCSAAAPGAPWQAKWTISPSFVWTRGGISTMQQPLTHCQLLCTNLPFESSGQIHARWTLGPAQHGACVRVSSGQLLLIWRPACTMAPCCTSTPVTCTS